MKKLFLAFAGNRAGFHQHRTWLDKPRKRVELLNDEAIRIEGLALLINSLLHDKPERAI